jgi:DNA-binding LytR/AlgR family response regulator
MMKYLKKGLEVKSTPLLFVRVDPVWKEFKDDPGFIRLLEQSFEPEKKEQIVNIRSDTREALQINLKKLLFVEAQENYSRIVWLENEKPREQLLRATLKNIEKQIANEQIIRCHRSFIINTLVPFKILGNSNGYHLRSDLFPDTIPISRSLGKEIVAKLREPGA